MKTIELDKELILVEVPKDARHFALTESHSYFKSPRIEHSIGGFGLDRKYDYEIIGLIETPNVDFDFDVELNWVFSEGYEMFTNENMDETKRKLFRTRIQSKIQDAGLYLVNPICNPFYIKQIGENMRTSTYIADWQFKEKKTIKGNLLLIKKLQ